MCQDKIKFGGLKSFASNVEYQGDISLNTKLLEVDCVSVEDVIEDLYLITDEIILNSNLTTLTTSCGTLPTIRNEKTLIQYLININCAQQIQIDALIEQTRLLAEQVTTLQNNPCN